eukprot:2118121-Alexandrium_andersonii.AAC.1
MVRRSSRRGRGARGQLLQSPGRRPKWARHQSAGASSHCGDIFQPKLKGQQQKGNGASRALPAPT